MRAASALLLLTLSAATGCATTSLQHRSPPREVERALQVATELLGSMSVSVNGHTYRTDCSGLVSACYGEAGHPIDDELPPAESATEALWLRFRRAAVGVAKVRAGDLAFFHNTYDRNGNGLRDDRFTHVALVASVDADGTVHFVHYASGEVRLDVMNLRHKADARDPRRGKVWNSYLRRGGGKVLAGQLFFRFVRVIR